MIFKLELVEPLVRAATLLCRKRGTLWLCAQERCPQASQAVEPTLLRAFDDVTRATDELAAAVPMARALGIELWRCRGLKGPRTSTVSAKAEA